jgi:hypothetical protein
MFFKTEPVQVKRLTQPIGNWGDPTETLVGTYQAGIEPFTGDDGLHNDQMMENVRDILIFSNVNIDIQYSDILFYRGVDHKVAYIERFNKGVIPHCEVFSADSQ